MLLPTQPASNDPASNDHVNPPAASELFPIDASIDSINTNPEIPTRPTPIDCFVPAVKFDLNPNPPLHPTEVDCCLPEFPDFKIPVNACHV